MSPRSILRWAIGLWLASVSICLAADTLPPDRSALVLYKCLPYNQTWDDLTSIEIEVLALSVRDVERGQALAHYLDEIATQARAKNANSPSVTTRVRGLDVALAEGFAGAGPQVLFLISTEEEPSEVALQALDAIAMERSILVVTDQESLLEKHAAVGFLLSKEHRAEIVIDLERARSHGAHFRARFIPLARQIGGAR